MTVWHAYVYGLAFFWGAIWGSFANVCIFRLPRKLSIVFPNSFCPNCRKNIKPYDNIPMLSYLLLGGKCRYCQAQISPRYPVVELIMAVLSVALIARLIHSHGVSDLPDIFRVLPLFSVYFIFLFLLILITYIDIDTFEIPNIITFPGIIAGFILFVLLRPRLWLDSLLGIVFGFLAIYLLIELYYLLRKKEGMGLGDAKLLGMIGAFLGYKALLPILLLSSLQGVLIGVPILYQQYRKQKGGSAGQRPQNHEESISEASAEPTGFSGYLQKHPIPFGPFLSLAALEYLFLGDLILRLLRIKPF